MKPEKFNPLPDCPNTPNCKKISFSIKSDSTSTLKALKIALEEMGVAEFTEKKLSIDAIFRIPIFGWKDDVSILIKPEEKSTTVFVRSASREGHWDIGANAIRVNKLKRHTKKQFSN